MSALSAVHLARNRSARSYSTEMQRRVRWGIGRCLFHISPRPFFAFRRALLRCFGAKVGRNVNIYPSALIYYPWNLKIGDWSSVGEWALIYNLGTVTIGQRSTISQRAHLCAGTHDYRDPAMPLLKPPIQLLMTPGYAQMHSWDQASRSARVRLLERGPL